MAQHGLTMGFSNSLIPQLKQRDSIIPIDDNIGSWIASILGFALVGGNFIVPTVMAKYGRRTANMLAIVFMLAGWFCITLANSIPSLIFARILQGLSMGISASVGPVLIGEYTSPNNRGAFLTTISLCIAMGVLTVHTMGSFLKWQTTALVCAFIAFVDLIIILYSPESPSFLADHGRFEDSARVYRWLRGDGEEPELERMLDTATVALDAKANADIPHTCGQTISAYIAYFKATVVKKEFIKPIFIMMHIYTLSQWAGANVLVAYATLLFENIVGPGYNIPLMIIILDIQRIISNICAVYVIKKIKRRRMLFITVGINLFAFLSIAGYSFLRSRNMLPFDSPVIGLLLIHVHMFSIATGTVPLPFIIAGEVFPLEYRSLAGGISVLFLSFNLFLSVKTAPMLLYSAGIHGTYLVYAGIVGYCLLVAGIFLPETKDRTLQEIEDGFRGRSLSPVEKTKRAQSLTSWKFNTDRRCSSPVI